MSAFLRTLLLLLAFLLLTDFTLGFVNAPVLKQANGAQPTQNCFASSVTAVTDSMEREGEASGPHPAGFKCPLARPLTL